ncbi:MAG: glycosyl transferase group 1 [Armatimonadetes bacterium]|jgi:glycosyltransferase involved in cell wall biosynthesis|nr:glycosyl transferase group 1 [Armatimonadota bacterium]
MATKRLRMVIGARRHGLGGAERVAQFVEESLAADGWEVDWFTADDVPRHATSRRYPGLNEALRTLALNQALRKLPPVDLTFSHGASGAGAPGRRAHLYHGTYAGLAQACRAGLPRLDYLVVRFVNGFLEQWSGAGASRVGVSRRVCSEVQRFYGLPNSSVIHNGVDVDRFGLTGKADHRQRWNLPQKRHLVLIVGRMDYGKGRDTLVRMFPHLSPDVEVVLVAPTASGLDRLPEGRIHLLPGVPYQDLPSVYAACDTLLCTSLYEGFGLTLVEGWAAGLPVVTGRVGVVDELLKLEPSFDACVAKPGDAERLAGGVERLRREPELARRQAEWGRQLTRDRFSQERFGEAYRTLVRSVMDAPAGSSVGITAAERK